MNSFTITENNVGSYVHLCASVLLSAVLICALSQL